MSTNDGGGSAVGCSEDYATNSIGCVRPMTCNSRYSMRYPVSLLWQLFVGTRKTPDFDDDDDYDDVLAADFHSLVFHYSLTNSLK